MRAICLALTLAAVPSAAAEYRTEVIPLRYFQVSQFQEVVAAPTFRGERRLPLKDALLPKGIIAWAADTRANSLAVTGTAEGLNSVKQVLRLLDIPPRQIRISVSTPRLDEGLLKELQQTTAPDEDGLWAIPLTDAAHQARVKAAPGGPSASLVTSNNAPMRMRIRGEDGPFVSLTPRLNGDNTITFAAPGEDFGKAAGGLLVLRRVPSGLPLLVTGKGVEGILVISAEVLPEK
jgi:hypothetical protein